MHLKKYIKIIYCISLTIAIIRHVFLFVPKINMHQECNYIIFNYELEIDDELPQQNQGHYIFPREMWIKLESHHIVLFPFAAN